MRRQYALPHVNSKQAFEIEIKFMRCIGYNNKKLPQGYNSQIEVVKVHCYRALDVSLCR